MNKYLKHSLFWLFMGLAGAAYLFLGCVPNQYHRDQGMKEMQRWFSAQEQGPINKTILLKDVRVCIVGDRVQFKWTPAQSIDSGIAAYADTDNDVWILGRICNGKIIVNENHLGHEFLHLLNWVCPEIANPDNF